MTPTVYKTPQERREAFFKYINGFKEFEENQRKKIAEMEAAGLL